MEKSIAKPETTPAEVVESARPPGVDPNVLVIQLITRSTSAEEADQARKSAREALELAKEYELFQLEMYRKRADATIDAKSRDPDEIDKRANNANRRWLRLGVLGLGLISLCGSIETVAVNGSTFIGFLLGTIGVSAVAALSVLGSGESQTASDIARVLGAWARVARSSAPPDMGSRLKGSDDKEARR